MRNVEKKRERRREKERGKREKEREKIRKNRKKEEENKIVWRCYASKKMNLTNKTTRVYI